MSDPKDTSVPILRKASEYANWAGAMCGYLTFLEAWPAISPGATNTADYAKHNAHAQGAIIMRTDRSLHRLLFNTDNADTPLSAKEMWEALKKAFGTPDAAYVWSQFSTLIKSGDLSDSKSLQDQISKVRSTLKEIDSGGIALADNLKALLILSKLPGSYVPLVSAIMWNI